MLADHCSKNVVVLCIGKYKEDQFKTLNQYGANTIIISEQSEQPNVRSFSDIISAVIKQRTPYVVLFPASHFGKSVAAILSTRFEAGLTADCIDIEVTDHFDLYFSRAAMNDSVIAKIKCINCDIKMCTVKKNVFIKNKYRNVVTCNIEKFNFNCEDNTDFIKILSVTKKEVVSNVDINKYSIVFCIGRGVKSTETRNKIYQLASQCGAGIVGTRAVVEEEIIEKERQVGQSGKSISPKIYVGFGVSGASQHMVGIKNAGVIIAINNDENAAIFDYADYPIVEDVDVIVDELLRIQDASVVLS